MHKLTVALVAFGSAFPGRRSAASAALADGGCAAQKVVDSNAAPGEFGQATALDGGIAVIGAPGEDGMGATFVFERSGGTWIETAWLVPMGAQTSDKIGAAVDVCGDRILVGSPGAHHGIMTNAGAAYVFERQGSSWVETAKLVASDADWTDRFGVSVAVDGDTIVVGANVEDQAGFESGAAYVFELVAGTWTQTQKLSASDLGFGDWFGISTAVKGDWMAIGAIGADGQDSLSGAVYIFDRTPNGWAEFAKLVASDGASNDRFGWSVSISHHRVAVGAPAKNDGIDISGAVYVFQFDGASWLEIGKVIPADGPALSKLGVAVAIDDEMLVAGASSNADGISGSGSAYLFQDDGSGFAFTRKLRAPDAQVSDFFGAAVALSNGTALVGVYNNDDACPKNPNCQSGSAWFFEVPDFARGYCFGNSCPCANDDPVRGCARSSGKGAALFACGSASVALDDLAFGASGLTPGQPALLFRARHALDQGPALAFGDGLRCAGGEAKRLGVLTSDSDGAAGWGPGLAQLGGWQSGDTLRFQVLYRDPTASPCGAGFNTTHGIEALFAP